LRFQKFLALDCLGIGNFLDLIEGFFVGVSLCHAVTMHLIIVSSTDSSRHPMTPYEPVTLDKSSVAKTQLENAIDLWFKYGDVASIHTLAAAANVVFDALGKQIKAPSIIREYLRHASRAEYDRFTAAEVFFKHAARDLNKVLDYDPMQAEMLILDSIYVYREGHEELTT
jgi:hypothetical protein